jgi:hypothetical protein
MMCAPGFQTSDTGVAHLWITLLTVLALAVLCLTQALTTRRWPAEAASTLELTFSPPGGYYERDIQLKIEVPHPSTGKHSDVIFTVDGSVPARTSGEIYTQPILLSAATPGVTVIRARTVLPSGQLGPVVSASYFVGMPAKLPMISLIAEPADLWSAERGIHANYRQRGDAWERPVDITYVDEDRRSGFHILGGARIHGEASRSFDKMPLRLYFRQEYGTSRLEYPLFADSELRSFKRLVLHSGGQDWQFFPDMNWTLMRNQLVASLAFEVDGYAVHSEPALVFINGGPWGIYQIRERIDRHFLADHYGVEAADFLEDPQWLGQEAIRMGDSEHWTHLLEFIEAHDLADPDNYAHVQSQVDIANFIDYEILQIYAANIDWPFHNVQQFRPRVQGGRWHWVFWDTDQGFGAYPSSVHSNLMDRVLDDSHPDTGGRDTLLLRRLLKNPAVFDQFLSRTADLLNTTLSPGSVIVLIDALATELEPDIAYETLRWSSTVDWESSVEELRDFARGRPDVVRQHMVEVFNLDGTAQLAFDPPANGSGTVAANGILLPGLPWQGTYFYGVPVQVTAAPAPGYRFAGWDPPDIPQTPTITLTVNTARTVTPRFEPLGDDAPRPGDVVFGEYRMDENSHIEGGWFELHVTRPGGVDLRGWRVTDNDTKTATDEGSLIFTGHPAFARVPQGTTMRVIVPQTDADLPEDDLGAWDRQMVLYAGNGNLDTQVDPAFNLGPNDNLVLLAPGPTEAFGDDQGIAFAAEGTAVTPASFGVLSDGVRSTLAAPNSQPSQQTHEQPSTGWLLVAGLATLPFTVRWATQRTHSGGSDG